MQLIPLVQPGLEQRARGQVGMLPAQSIGRVHQLKPRPRLVRRGDDLPQVRASTRDRRPERGVPCDDAADGGAQGLDDERAGDGVRGLDHIGAAQLVGAFEVPQTSLSAGAWQHLPGRSRH